MKTIFENKVFKYFAYIILYLISSFLVFQGISYIPNSIMNYEVALLPAVPVAISFVLPLFGLIIMFVFWNCTNVHSKWTTLLVFVIIDSVLIVSCFALFVYLLVNNDGNFVKFTPFSPYDSIALVLIFAFLDVSALIYVISNRSYRKVPKTAEPILKKSRFFAMIIGFVLGTYFMGGFLSSLTYIGMPYDSNLPLAIFVILPFAFITLEVGAFGLYYGVRDFRRFKYFRTILFVLWILILVLDTAQVAVIMINPQIFIESMQGFFPFSMGLQFPVGILFTSIFPLIPMVFASIVFEKSKDEQQ